MRACQASSSSILSFVILCLGRSCSIQLVDFFSSFDLRFRAGRVTLHSSRSLNVGSALSLVYLLSWVEGFLLSSLRTPAGLILHNFILLINCGCDAYSLPWFHLCWSCLFSSCPREPLQTYSHKLCRTLYSMYSELFLLHYSPFIWTCIREYEPYEKWFVVITFNHFNFYVVQFI
jgi:hypothetical protein